VVDCVIVNVMGRAPAVNGMFPLQLPVVLADVKVTLWEALPPFPSLTVTVPEKSPPLLNTIV
jgi:hypothetical protein